MKATIVSSRFSRFFAAALLVLTFVLVLFTSCEKDEAIPEPPIILPPDTTTVDTTSVINAPDSVNDLIAWYNPFNSLLMVNPQFVEQVLITLQAQPAPTSEGGFIMQGINLDRKPVTVYFTIELAESPKIFAASTEIQQPLTPDLIQTFTEKGTTYKVYKNALCGKVSKGFEGPCYGSADGSSTRNFWYDIRKCERGDGFCTEALLVQGRRVTYHNANCQGPVKSEESLFGYGCWQ